VVIKLPEANTRDLDPNATPQAVARSVKPKDRPNNFDRIVKRAEKAQQKEEVTQVAAVAPRTVASSIPSRASVAKQATVRNAINLKRVNLIGVYGKPASRRALVRLSNGRYKKVAVGDRIDGGRVSAIGETELIYQKNGRGVTLKMPKG
jgi:type IV pilus biogenesis protein PilP